MTDPIADMLTRIRNAQMAKKRQVDVPFSKVLYAIARILQEEGYLGELTTSETPHPTFLITLKYDGSRPAIQAITRESTPGHRKYVQAQDLPRVLNDFGIAIISTSQGMMTNKKARALKIGGEILCQVY